ncbi:hypothetical protein LXL04_013158 [Taraxacum kok-saghyz]
MSLCNDKGRPHLTDHEEDDDDIPGDHPATTPIAPKQVSRKTGPTSTIPDSSFATPNTRAPGERTSNDGSTPTLDDVNREEFNSNFQKEAKSIENWERENLKAEKRKRDLKMKKITSPCNCKTRKNKGRTLCKHQGNIFGKTYVIERNHGDSSDSELCIRRSNKRLTDASMEESSTFDDPDHTFAIGEKIGIDWLCSQDEPMKIPQGNGDKIPPC